MRDRGQCLYLREAKMKTEEAEKLCNELETAAGQKLNREIKTAETYHYGYIQACEDFLAGITQSNADTP